MIFNATFNNRKEIRKGGLISHTHFPMFSYSFEACGVRVQ